MNDDNMERKTVIDIAIFCLCGFIANVGVLITGFGHGVIFIFCFLVCMGCGYTPTGYDRDEVGKTAFFIQALSLCSVQPYMTYRVQPRKHLCKAILIFMIPATIAGTPLGAIIGRDADPQRVAFVISILLFGLGVFEIYYLVRIYNARDLLCPSFLAKAAETQQRCGATVRERQRRGTFHGEKLNNVSGLRKSRAGGGIYSSGLKTSHVESTMSNLKASSIKGSIAADPFRLSRGISLRKVLQDSEILPLPALHENESLEGEFSKERKFLFDSKSPVYFIVGSQRSGLQLLQSLLNSRPDLALPPPTYLLNKFMPHLDKFGESSDDFDIEILVDHVCTFVERNPVPWLDNTGDRIFFDRDAVVDMVESYGEMFSKSIPWEEKKKCYLVAIMDQLNSIYATNNKKTTWICECLDSAEYHHLLKKYYSKDRLRYLYLVRDPRDVVLSLKAMPVENCHVYALSKAWNEVQHNVLEILEDKEDSKLVHVLKYDNLLLNPRSTAEKLNAFLGYSTTKDKIVDNVRKLWMTATGKTETGVSAVTNNDENAVDGDKESQPKRATRRQSSFRNNKWSDVLSEEEIILLESLLYVNMKKLGYKPHKVGQSYDPLVFTQTQIKQFTRLNDEGREKMCELNAHYLHQLDVLRHPPDLISSPEYLSVEDDSDSIEEDLEETEKKGQKSINWPHDATTFGSLSREDVEQRLEVVREELVELGDGYMLKVAVISQRGFYPFNKDKENDDAIFIETCVGDKSNHHWFALYNGHGPQGKKCAEYSGNKIYSNFRALQQSESNECANNLTKILEKAYMSANTALSREQAVHASKSGTTVCALYFQGRQCCISNLGDSRCISGSLPDGQPLSSTLNAKALAKEHSSFCVEERERIKRFGGHVCTTAQYDERENSHEKWDAREDPPRVWAVNRRYPGTTCTRSIGDTLAGEIMCSRPEFCEHKINATDRLIVLTSGCLRTHFTDEELISIAADYDNPLDSCKVIMGESYRLNAADEHDFVDDISVLVAFVVPPDESSNIDVEEGSKKKMRRFLSLKRRRSFSFREQYVRDDSKAFRDYTVRDVLGELRNIRSGESSVREFVNRNVQYEDDKKRMRDFTWFEILWTVSMGFSAGFLGTLCSIRAPPLILFFMHPPVRLSKYSQRATGTLISRSSVYARLILYIDASIRNTDITYFRLVDWPLYLSLTIFSNLGVVLGGFLFHKVSDSRAFIKTAMAILLILCSIALLVRDRKSVV